ncbi:MAG: GumC family protein [Rubripirellula sp.]
MDRKLSTADAWATVTPADLLRSISHRLPSVIFTTLLVTAVIAGILLAWPNQYSSDGLFYVRLGRAAVSADPTAQASGSVSVQESRASEVHSISEMMTSREVADRVVKAVGAREINQPRTWVDRSMKGLGDLFPRGSDNSGSMERGSYDRQLAHESAVERIRSAIKVSVPKEGYTLAVSSQCADPLLAQSIVQALMDEYGSYHVEAHRSNGALDFFERQTKASQHSAIETRKMLQKTRNEMGWMSTDSAEETLRQRILNSELALDQAESDYADSESLMKALKSQLTTVEPWIEVETSQVADNAADGMRTALYEYQVNEGERLSKVTPNHPRYKLLREKIDSGEEIVSSQGTERQQTREAVNPVHLQLETAYQTAMARTAGLKSRREALKGSLEEAQEDLQRLNADMVKLAELNWRAEITEKNYLSHAESLESARLVHELDNQQMSDVSVIQNASLNLTKVGPPRLALTMVGGLLGLCLGILQALVRDNPVAASSAKASPLAYASNPEQKDSASSGSDGLAEKTVENEQVDGPQAEDEGRVSLPR